MVRKCLDAFVKKDSALARSSLLSDDAVDDQRDANYEKIVEYMEQHPKAVRPCMSLFAVVRAWNGSLTTPPASPKDALFLVEGVGVRHHAEARQPKYRAPCSLVSKDCCRRNYLVSVCGSTSRHKRVRDFERRLPATKS